MSKPIQLVIGPGKIGKKLPIIPKTMNIAAIKIRNMSINYI